MNSELNEFKRSASSPKALFAYAVAVVLIAAYIYFYQYAPLGAPFDNLILNTITSLAALGTATIATLVFRRYTSEDYPRKIWLYLMIGCWFWFAAEVIWQAYAYVFEEVPAPSFADLGWVLGFVAFTIAFYYQYAAIKPAHVETVRIYAIGTWIVILLIPLLLLTFWGAFTIESYIDFYYPFADLAVGVAGLALIFIFRGGALMRPWIGLMVFGASDLLYAWAEKTQMYAWSVENGNLLSLGIDLSYLVAYIILAIGFLGQLKLLHRGLRQR
jgi:hypothetical protein